MISKKGYTKIFMFLGGMSRRADEVEACMKKWWVSKRSKSTGGLRLTDEGLDFVINTLKVEHYKVPFAYPVEYCPHSIVFLDQYMDTPYYLSKNYMIVFTQRRCLEFYVFANDLRQYGMMKALKKRADDPLYNI